MKKLTEQESKWYALYTRARAEKKLYTLLTQKKVDCFLPLKNTLVQRSDRKKWVQLPLLPSYLFVKVSEQERYTVLNTPGAVRYVSFEGKAVSIPEKQLIALQQMIQNNGENVEADYGKFDKGDIVEVREGPLRGIQGEVVQIRGKQRLLLRFDSLGYVVHVEASMVELQSVMYIAV
ncbi:UpxY family transcription antiterminator [Catalinimonas niigatensis]|uniref:UpxY family transcription antiterminator n=1 Tax=Catalinimonas niigatensis TaxID=1397264 RepID=UPI00266706FB|nr:UpxY family transcription antiterminator [Catalinimonas niigatensis]WPP52912.1 UpxY family transcription antiterminator [Catalinimonas niigatensis]